MLYKLTLILFLFSSCSVYDQIATAPQSEKEVISCDKDWVKYYNSDTSIDSCKNNKNWNFFPGQAIIVKDAYKVTIGWYLN